MSPDYSPRAGQSGNETKSQPAGLPQVKHQHYKQNSAVELYRTVQ